MDRRKKKILFCTHEQFWPLTGGCTAGNFNIIKHLTNNGFEVTVSTPLYVDKEQTERDFNVKMEPFSPYYMHRKVKFRTVKYLLYGFLSLFHIVRVLLKNRFDYIYVNNVIIAFPFLFIKFFIKTPVVIRYTDFLSGFLYEDKSYPKFIIDVFRFYEYKVAHIFDRIYVITEKMKDELSRCGKVDPAKILVTWDGVDGSVFDRKKIPSGNREEIRKKLHIPMEATQVLFHGTIEPHHGEDIIPTLANRILSGKNENFYLVLIGVGKGYQQIKEVLKDNPRVRMLDFVEYREIPKYIEASDIGIVPYPKNRSMDMVLTLKLLEYLSIGTPCVLFDLESVKDVFGKYDFIKISQGMDEFVQNVLAMKGFGKSDIAAELIQKNFTWEQVGRTIQKDLLSLR